MPGGIQTTRIDPTLTAHYIKDNRRAPVSARAQQFLRLRRHQLQSDFWPGRMKLFGLCRRDRRAGPGTRRLAASCRRVVGSAAYRPRPRCCRFPTFCRPQNGGVPAGWSSSLSAVALEATAHADADPDEWRVCSLPPAVTVTICHEICQALALAAREVSPTRFANSVHNAAAGYWSIATGSMMESNVLCAFDASFVAGLLDAMTQLRWIGKRCCWSPMTRNIPRRARQASDPRRARSRHGADAGANRDLAGRYRSDAHREGADKMADPELEALRVASRRALAAAAALLAGGVAGTSGSRLSRCIARRRSGPTMRLRSRLDRGATFPITGACACSMKSSTGTRTTSAAAPPRTALPDNPLRSHGRLGAASGIEYAAQAMALHGALAGAAPGATCGRVASRVARQCARCAAACAEAG